MAADHRGYYSALGLSPGATADEIKRAYRELAKKYHPDRNPGDLQAKAKFQFIQAAYETLSDPFSRAAYDTAVKQPASEKVESVEPVVCCKCGCLTAQPRYIIFWQVISLLVVTMRMPIQGIFCRRCADRTAVKASLITWAAGWWGFPWGPIYSIGALFQNAFGGEQPPEPNGYMLGRQAVYFLQRGRVDVSKGILDHALKLKIYGELRSTLENLRRSLGETKTPQLTSQWRVLRGAFAIQFTPIALVAALLSVMFIDPDSLTRANEWKAPPVQMAQEPTSSLSTEYSPSLATGPNSAFAAPNASPTESFDRPPVFITPGLVHSPRHRGVAPLTVRTRSGLDYFVKLVDMSTGAEAMSFYLRGGAPMTVMVPLGSYELRYAAGEVWYGLAYRFGPATLYSKADDIFTFTSELTPDGINYAGWTVELILQPNGNLRTTSIDAVDF